MEAKGCFPPATLAVIDSTRYLYLRAGDTHRFVAVWVVVVAGRVLVRPWNDDPDGWYRAFLREKRGALRLGQREVRVRAVPAPAARLLAAMDLAYAAKYTTAANRTYVRGFATPGRRASTLELLPG